jgi:gas vesicle protein
MTERLNRELSTINESIMRLQEDSDTKIRQLKKHMKPMKLEPD